MAYPTCPGFIQFQLWCVMSKKSYQAAHVSGIARILEHQGLAEKFHPNIWLVREGAEWPRCGTWKRYCRINGLDLVTGQKIKPELRYDTLAEI